MRTGNHGLANRNWRVANERGNSRGIEHATLAVLMDIREELRAVSGRLDCFETMSIPRLLARIAQNTTKPKKREKS